MQLEQCSLAQNKEVAMAFKLLRAINRLGGKDYGLSSIDSGIAFPYLHNLG
jgi:hypothetical protein